MPVGTERKAPNGYWYVKTDRGWVLKHWLEWAKHNDRPVDSKKEQIRFVNGNKEDFSKTNLVAIPKGKVRIRQKLAALYAQRDDVAAQIKYYEAQLEHES